MWILERLRSLLKAAALLPAMLHVLIFRISPDRGVIGQDMARWLEHAARRVDIHGFPEWKRFAWILWKFTEFRNVFYYRVRQQRHWPSRCLLEIAKRLYPERSDLWLACPDIGPGLFIQHGFATAVGARRIGANCWINQQVTIGFAHDGGHGPVIGDNVRIAAGAKVLGDLVIGDNSTVAPNSYVRKSVPANSTVVGVPAAMVQQDGRPVRPGKRESTITSAQPPRLPGTLAAG